MGHYSLGLGVGTQSAQGEWLEVFYPEPLLNPSERIVNDLVSALGAEYATGNHTLHINLITLKQLAQNIQHHTQQLVWLKQAYNANLSMVVTLLETDAPPTSTAEAYLKLQLLSTGLVKPHEQNLTDLFALLPNVAWTNEGPISLDELTHRQMAARTKGQWLHVHAIDKFPPMADYHVPKGVRIGDASRVRLGAHLAAGTTVMHEGFVNFNAGTLGNSMIEGRISAGVVVGNNSDLGGGCSTMGTLSGGGKEVISVGEDCLIGANAGIGIAIGQNCIIEAGLYITAGTKVALLDGDNKLIDTVKAASLSGKSHLLFRRNSTSGKVEAKPHNTQVTLNDILHSHN